MKSSANMAKQSARGNCIVGGNGLARLVAVIRRQHQQASAGENNGASMKAVSKQKAHGEGDIAMKREGISIS